MIEPVAAGVWGWWLLGESLSALQGLGGVLVLTGALMVQLRRPRRAEEKRGQ
jgi:drug/metabolite transporter (DMT)-like permease